VDAMLNQLELSGKLADASGIIVGDFADIKTDGRPTLTLEQVFHKYFSKLDLPVMTGFKIGHCFPHFSVPLGAEAMVNTADKSLYIDAGVN
jgi:muramoyltetrapeptide carboxypeptidase